MGARTKVSWAPVLVVVPLIGNAQLDMGADWPAVKQEMIELGLRHDSAWDLYQYFEQNADDKTLEPGRIHSR